MPSTISRARALSRNRQVPRVPLPTVGVTSHGETLSASSEDITPRSLLIRTHAPNPSGSPFLRFFTSVRESLQVATSPCCQRVLPDSISANLSPDAWSPTPTVPSSARTCFFPDVSGLPQDTMGRLPVFIRECDFPAVLVFEVADISLCSSLRVCSSPRSLLPLRVFPQGSRDLLRPGLSCWSDFWFWL